MSSHVYMWFEKRYPWHDMISVCFVCVDPKRKGCGGLQNSFLGHEINSYIHFGIWAMTALSLNIWLFFDCVFVFFRWSEEQAITYLPTSTMTSTRQSFRSSLGRRRKATKREQSSKILLIRMTHRRAQGLTNPNPEHRHNSLSLFIMHFTLKRDPSLTEDTLLIIPQCNAPKGLGSNIRWCY